MEGAQNAGAAYIFELDANGAATFLTKITAPNASANDYFGGSVSIHDDILAVGAIGSDPDGILNAGAAYIFRLKPDKSVEFLSVITASDPSTYDYFGDVSISDNILAVGATNATYGGKTNAGAAYLYLLESNGSVSFLSKITAPDAEIGDRFGIVHMYKNILAVGAWSYSEHSRTVLMIPVLLMYTSWNRTGLLAFLEN